MDNGFDPLSGLYLAQLERPQELEAINLRTLSPFQRALLVIDGTVTKTIEAYTMEPLDIVPLAQVERRLDATHRWLDAAEGDRVAVRHVLIRGLYSHRFWVYAVSFVAMDRLPEAVRERVEGGGEGLGRVLDEAALETRREVLWYGREELDELPEAVSQVSDGVFLSRTYRVIAGGRPLMLINEKFPWIIDYLPSQP